jgi:hypothetical protein
MQEAQSLPWGAVDLEQEENTRGDAGRGSYKEPSILVEAIHDSLLVFENEKDKHDEEDEEEKGDEEDDIQPSQPLRRVGRPAKSTFSEKVNKAPTPARHPRGRPRKSERMMNASEDEGDDWLTTAKRERALERLRKGHKTTGRPRKVVPLEGPPKPKNKVGSPRKTIPVPIPVVEPEVCEIPEPTMDEWSVWTRSFKQLGVNHFKAIL